MPRRAYVHNFGILVAVVTGVTSVLWFVVSVRDEGWLDAAAKGLAGGAVIGILLLPLIFLGWAIYLPLVTALTRGIETPWKARLIAVGIGPVNMGVVYVALHGLRPGWEVVAYMIAVGVVYGSLVRLPSRMTG